MAKAIPKKADDGIAVIQPGNFVAISVSIRSKGPYVQEAFSGKAKLQMMTTMSTPASEKKGKSARPPRNFDEDFKSAQHLSTAGWIGIPCAAFRQAMVDACRTVNLPMTKAKIAITEIKADGFDVVSGQPLIRLQAGAPERTEMLVRNDNGSADIRIRPMWREWAATVSIEFDADMITAESVVNLLDRAGRQIGIGGGRPFSKNSCGQGWGTFTVDTTTTKEEAA